MPTVIARANMLAVAVRRDLVRMEVSFPRSNATLAFFGQEHDMRVVVAKFGDVLTYSNGCDGPPQDRHQFAP
jgi:hypothetical protein